MNKKNILLILLLLFLSSLVWGIPEGEEFETARTLYRKGNISISTASQEQFTVQIRGLYAGNYVGFSGYDKEGELVDLPPQKVGLTDLQVLFSSDIPLVYVRASVWEGYSKRKNIMTGDRLLDSGWVKFY